MARPLDNTRPLARSLAGALMFIWMLLASSWSPATTLVLDDQPYQSLSGSMAWYRDSGGQMNIDDIILSDRQGLFTDAAGQPSFGYTSDTIWIRFTAVSQEIEHVPRLLGVSPSFLDHVRLFSVHNGKVQDLGIQGDREPWQQRVIPWRHSLYQLPHLNEGPVTFYVKLRSTSSIAANLTLWKSDTFAVQSASAMFLYGALLSAGVLVCALSLLFLTFLRQSVYLYFLLYALSYTLLIAQIEGIIHFIVAPATPLHLEWLQVVFQAAGLVTLVILFSKITDLKIYHPKINKALIFSSSAAAIIGIIPMMFGLYNISIPFYWMIFAAIFIAIPIATLFLRKEIGLVAYIYASAFGVVATGLIIRFAWVFGLSGPNILSENNFIIIVLSHIGIMFITLATKYVQLEKTMRSAGESALASIRHSEKLLENLVSQRTFELDQVNQSLEQQLKISKQKSIDLEKTYSRLSVALDAEKKAALEQRQFLRMVAHEFRTPLSVIQMASDLIASDPRTPEVHATTNCERIQHASERMAAVINQALREDKLDSAEWRKNARFIQISELLHNSISYGEMISSGNRSFSVVCDEHIYIQGDYDLLLTMLNNIIDNAVKYSAKNSSVHVIAEQRPDYSIVIQISDEGCGMSKEELSQVLDKYFRADTATGVPGMGLGLYIVDRIVRIHNATLTIHSTPGAGTIFNLSFPPPAQSAEARP
ncbi:sensor histidine kinase [Alcanivorax sp. 1008]|uniref:sensor histidine kinase n=1 Tax=Alcanivorax sp. 1008 TaxID=2816853 RepID=UPI001D59C351|nr:sensor histidine kinase [Alcanivorax sp. 1008]MCC1496386.1 sensor histidine kinase [Alcanivorax sp. 1008]